MGTQATIILKLRDEDCNKTLKMRNNIYPCFFTFDTRCFEPIENNGYQYIGCRVFHDGYEEGVGQALIERYNTYEKVLNTILLGDMSGLPDECDEDIHNFYQAYDDCAEPILLDTLDDIGKLKTEYVYVWDEGKVYMYVMKSWDEHYNFTYKEPKLISL